MFVCCCYYVEYWALYGGIDVHFSFVVCSCFDGVILTLRSELNENYCSRISWVMEVWDWLNFLLS